MIKKTIYILLGVSIVATLVLLAGLGGAFWITYNEPQPASPILEDEIQEEIEQPANEETSTFRVLVLGDSLAKGTGDETGLGYSGYFNKALSDLEEVVIEYENLGIDGMVSKELLELVEQEVVKTAIAEADIILLSIGGNDVRTLPVFQGISPIDFTQTKTNYLENLEQILQIIRENNSDVLVAKLGLYNPFGNFVDEATVELLHQWNFETLKTIESKDSMVFVPTFDLFKYNINYVSHDMLHPNSEGYQAIAQRHMGILTELISR